LLVGFKYIGKVLSDLEDKGQHGELTSNISSFAVGAEESHGILVTPDIRDKDAAGGALLLAELASFEKDRGRTLLDTLNDLWNRVGYIKNGLTSTVMRGAEGTGRIQAILASLRTAPPTEIGGYPVTAFFDRQDPEGVFGPILSETDRSSRNVLVFQLGEDARVILRPSGTEPKAKIYVEVAGRPGQDGEFERPRVDAQCAQLADAFALYMLAAGGIELPLWALKANDLLSVEHKAYFAREVIPEALERLERGEEVQAWLGDTLKPLGPGAAQLLAPAVQAYLDQANTPHADSLRQAFT